MSVIPPSAGVRPEPGEGVTPSVRAEKPKSTHPTSIEEFLTDGSLAGLCAELSRLTGVSVELRDAHGRLIIVDLFPPSARENGEADADVAGAGVATRRT